MEHGAVGFLFFIFLILAIAFSFARFAFVVEDSARTRHAGYARVGGWFMGTLSDQVDIVWD